MIFKKIKKWSFHETWQNKNRKYGLVSYIHKAPNCYYFSVSCYRIRCGNMSCISCNNKFRYSSLENQLTYKTFEECVEAIKKWYRIYIK